MRVAEVAQRHGSVKILIKKRLIVRQRSTLGARVYRCAAAAEQSRGKHKLFKRDRDPEE
jgi:hypothetical protein